MATAKSIAIRKERAIERIAAGLGDVTVRHRDPRLAEAMTLEAIADAVGQERPTDLQAAIDGASREELLALAGVGEVTVDRMMQGRAERIARRGERHEN